LINAGAYPKLRYTTTYFDFFSSLDNLQEQSPRPTLRYTTAAGKTFWFFWFLMLKNQPELNKTGLVEFFG